MIGQEEENKEGSMRGNVGKGNRDGVRGGVTEEGEGRKKGEDAAEEKEGSRRGRGEEGRWLEGERTRGGERGGEEGGAGRGRVE